MKEKVINIFEQIMKVYPTVYVILLHIIGIGLISLDFVDYNMGTADIILQLIILTILFMMSNIAFLIPSLFVIVIGSIISFFMTISVSIFLFFSLFELLGAESVNVLEYGFFKSLGVCILGTPFGYMNLLSLKKLGLL